MRKIQGIAGLAGILAFLSCPVHSETLEQAWQQALQHNHRLKSADVMVSSSKQQLYSAEGQRLPRLEISGGYTQLSETPAAKTRIGGQTAIFNTNEPGSGRAKAMVSVPVFTSGRIHHDIESAKARLKATQHQQTSMRQEIKRQVGLAFIAVLRSESALEVADSHVETLKAHARDVDNLFAQGMVARNDQLAAQVELANAKQQVVQLTNQLEIAKAQYNQVLNRPLDSRVELTPEFLTPLKEDLSSLIRQAVSDRPEMAVLLQNSTALKRQADSIKAGLLPQLAVKGGYQYQENRYQAYEGIWQVGVGMNWRLFDGSTRHQGESLLQQALSIKEQQQDLRSLITLQVRKAWMDREETRKRIKVTQQAIVQADENLKVTMNRYQQGLSTNTDVLKAEDLRTLTHDNYNNARFDLEQAKIQLHWATGAL